MPVLNQNFFDLVLKEVSRIVRLIQYSTPGLTPKQPKLITITRYASIILSWKLKGKTLRAEFGYRQTEEGQEWWELEKMSILHGPKLLSSKLVTYRLSEPVIPGCTDIKFRNEFGRWYKDTIKEKVCLDGLDS